LQADPGSCTCIQILHSFSFICTLYPKPFLTYFIKKHGYSPSYDEIKDGLEYNSKATIALHINGLIEKGHLHKKFNSARSLELVQKKEVPIQDRVNAALSKSTLKDRKVLADALDMLDYPELSAKVRTYSPL